MVAQAAALADGAGLDQVEVSSSTRRNPSSATRAERFDLLSASLVLFFLPDPGDALVRWRALCRPGGEWACRRSAVPTPPGNRIDQLFRALPPAADARARRTTGAAGPFESDAGVEGLFTAAGWVDARSAESPAGPVREP